MEYATDTLKTMHISCDDVPYVEMEAGLEYRMLQARPCENLAVTQIRAQPYASSQLHRHVAPVLGYTTMGSWGHDRSFEYGPGSYIYETPGVLHRFLNGPELTEALFISLGDMEYVDPETGEVIQSLSAETMVVAYLEGCEAAGRPRPNVLT